MSGYFQDWGADSSDEYNNGDSGEVAELVDPLESLPRRDQDIFFRLLDLLPDNKREFAMEYFYDHPAKIKAVIEHIKRDNKAVIKNQDTIGAKAVLADEQVDLDESLPLGDDDEESEDSMSTDEDNY